MSLSFFILCYKKGRKIFVCQSHRGEKNKREEMQKIVDENVQSCYLSTILKHISPLLYLFVFVCGFFLFLWKIQFEDFALLE
jgi:hypothetical protein